MTDEIRQRLLDLSEGDYKRFSASLLPGVDNILGIRLPILRDLAKQLAVREGILSYLSSNDEIYFEEIMLKGFIIGCLKTDIDTFIELLRGFVPKINNWSVCDSFCAGLKFAKKYPKEILDFILGYQKSDREFELRFMVTMLMDYYMDSEHLNTMFSVFDSIDKSKYYVQMAVAFAVSVCLVKFPQQAEHYLQHNQLDDFTYNKSLQKAIESRRISNQKKDILRGMKRKKRNGEHE